MNVALLDTAERQAAAEIAKAGKCASCGKNPPMEGFSLCIYCRVKAGLPVDARSLAEFDRRAAQEKAKSDKAHADFAARKKEAPMSETVTLTCPECGKECANPQGRAAHRRFVHGVRGAVPRPVKKVQQVKQATGGGTMSPSPEVPTVAQSHRERDDRVLGNQQVFVEPETKPAAGGTDADHSETIPPADEPHEDTGSITELEAGLVRQAITIYRLQRSVVASKTELADTHLRLIGATIEASGSIHPSVRASIEGEIERVRELVREVSR